MIILPIFARVFDGWTILAVILVAGSGLALLDRRTVSGRISLGPIAFCLLLAEEVGSVLYAYLGGDEKALALMWPVVFLFVAIAIVYGAARTAIWALPNKSSSP